MYNKDIGKHIKLMAVYQILVCCSWQISYFPKHMVQESSNGKMSSAKIFTELKRIFLHLKIYDWSNRSMHSQLNFSLHWSQSFIIFTPPESCTCSKHTQNIFLLFVNRGENLHFNRRGHATLYIYVNRTGISLCLFMNTIE